MANNNVVSADLNGGWSCVTAPLWQWDYGQVLEITGIDDLPSSFVAHCANRWDGSSQTVLGSNGRISIPNALLTSGEPVYVWIVRTADGTDGETKYKITIPVNRRAAPTDYPTTAQQSAITQAINALNTAAANAAAEVAAELVDPTLAVSGKAADAAKTGEELGNLKSDFINYKTNNLSGVENIGVLSNFHVGGLSISQDKQSATINTNQKYRVSTATNIYADRQYLITIASGFKIAVIEYTPSLGTYYDGGWRTGTFNFYKGSTFIFVIARSTENTSEVASVAEFTNAVTFTATDEIRFDDIDTNLASKGIYLDNDKKIIPCYITSGTKFDIETVDGSNFKNEYLYLYDCYGNYVDFYSLKNQNTNKRSITHNGATTIYYVKLHNSVGAVEVSENVKITRYGNTGGQLDANSSLFNVDENLVDQTKITEYLSTVSDNTDSESLIFFTDPHTLYHTYNVYNHKKLLDTISEYFKQTNIGFVLCGGDWLQNNDTEAEAISKLATMQGEMRSLFADNQFLMLGNHDNNYQGETTINNGKLINVLFPKHNKAYYKFIGKNTDFYVLDTGSDHDETMNAYRWEQVSWLGNALKENTSNHIAISLHIWWNSYQDSFPTPLAENVAYLITAFNKRITTELNGVVYDFSDVTTGRIEFVICGHTHIDNNYIVDNSVPVICTLNTYNSGVVSFDMIFADYANKTIHLTRVGSGNSREFSLETGQPLM